jgi:plastocyanin
MLRNIAAIFSTVLVSSAFADTITSSTTSTSSAPIATHTVAVGVDGFNFWPNQIYANVHDIIEYQFYPLNHSVVRAAFGPTPCIPYEWTVPGRVGFYSGFQPVSQVLANPPSFRVEVNDTEPIFFYCSAPGACFEGMIGVINPVRIQWI